MTHCITSHAVIHIGIASADSVTIPVLIDLSDANRPFICRSVGIYARYLQRQGVRSYESITKSVIAIGKLRDFYLLVLKSNAQHEISIKTFLEDFLYAFDNGTALKWKAASNQQYKYTKRAIADFIKFSSENNSKYLDEFELEFINTCRAGFISTGHAEKSLLFHTKKRNKKKESGRKRKVNGVWLYRAFPIDLVSKLIELTKNPRDKILFAMLAYGGRRLSELLNLFIQDVGAIEERLVVKLRHPTMSTMSWSNSAARIVSGQRRDYLRETYGCLARTEHGALPTFAGWKGMKYDDEAALSSDMYWIKDSGNYMLNLHRVYAFGYRSRLSNNSHPYYFTSENGSLLTTKAVEKQFRIACNRLEKKCDVDLTGYSIHSLRHFYGFYCADVLKAELLLIQKWMGHVQPSSTAIYSHISPATAAKELYLAERSAAKNIERPKKLSPTIFGQFDASLLTRKIK